MYRYVGNNSTNYTDPTGMWWWDDLQNFGHSIGSAFDSGVNAINNAVVQPLVNNVINPIGNAINTNIITPFNYTVADTVSFYSNYIAEGQREGGAGGLLKQGVGYLGGSFVSLPGTASDFVGANGKRIAGAARAVFGAGEIYGGVTTSATVVGVPIGALVVANGVDNFQAGLRQLWTGEEANTLLYDATKQLTGSSNLPEFDEA